MTASPDQAPPSTGRPPAGPIALWIERLLHLIGPHLVKLQVLMLVLFLIVLLAPLMLGDVAVGSGPFADIGAISGLLLWGVWLPLVLVTAVLAGRAWCGLLCPMGAASEWMSRIGLQRPTPNWLKWSGLPLASFLVVSVLNEATGADDNPLALAILFGSLFFAAITVGFLFGRNKRAWCRHACPVGLTLGMSARLSAVTLQPKTPRPDGERYSEKTVCPTMIDLKRKTESRHCLVCAKCIAPQARGGLSVAFRRLGTEIRAVASTNPSLVEVLFLFSAIGIAAGVMLEDLPGAEEWIMGVLGLGDGLLATAAYFAVVTVATAAVLSATTVLAALGTGAARPGRRWQAWFYRFGYAIAPLSLAALIFCMCAVAFEALAALGVPAGAILAVKGVILLAALAWCSSLVRGTVAPRAAADAAPDPGCGVQAGSGAE